MKVTCKKVILERLRSAGRPLAAHEFNHPDFTGYSENCIATRLSEMALAGVLIGRFRQGKPFKEWLLVANTPENQAVPGLGAIIPPQTPLATPEPLNRILEPNQGVS